MLEFHFQQAIIRVLGQEECSKTKLNKTRTFAFNRLTDLRYEERRWVNIMRLPVHRPAVQLLQELLSQSIFHCIIFSHKFLHLAILYYILAIYYVISIINNIVIYLLGILTVTFYLKL